MQIGLDAISPEDEQHVRDLGVTWTKATVQIGDPASVASLLAHLVYCRSLGIRAVTDLRVSEAHGRLVELQRKGHPEQEQEAQDIIASMAAGAADIARQAGNLCTEWEFFGEYDCPLVGGLWPNKSTVYSAYLAAVHDAIKATQPGARIWNGGWGVQFQDHHFPPLVEECPDKFDVLNWHQYNIMSYWPPYTEGPLAGRPRFDAPLAECAAWSADLFRQVFAKNRAMLTAHGLTQPFASSEWGMTTVARAALEGHRRALDLDSETLIPTDNPAYPLDGQGLGLADDDAAVYMDAWLQAFEDGGLEVCVIHRLRDSSVADRQHNDSTFWGHFVGLQFSDGTNKAVYDVVKQWAQKGGK